MIDRYTLHEQLVGIVQYILHGEMTASIGTHILFTSSGYSHQAHDL